LITNYSGSSGTISFNQSGGNGTSNCGVLGCNIDNVSVNTSSCDLSTGDYTLNGSVEFIAAPDVGQLIIEDCNGNQATFSAPFTSPVNYSFIGLTADGSSCDVTAYFTDDNQCTLTESYTAPECDCSVDAGTDQEVCEDETITLTASNPDNGTITWNQGVSDGVAFTPAVGTQSYTVSMDLGGCSVTDDVEVIVHPKPTVTTRNDTLICENESITLSGGGADNYSWDNNVTDGISFIPTQTNTYTVTGTITYECENSSQVTITVESLPEVSFQADSLTGCMPFTTTFTNTSTPSNATARWDFGDGAIGNSNTTITHTFDDPDCYTVNLEVETTNGCLSDLTIADYICVSGFPNASFGYTPTKPTTSESFVSFQNTSDNAITYEWDFGNGVTSVVPNPALDFGNEPESYIIELVAENKAGCTDTVYDVIEIKEEIIYYVPNTFTPDGNEFNDTFKPVFTIGFDFKNYHLSIFNRWGELIFESHNSEIGWDGSYGNGRKEIVPEGTYVWKIKYKETGVDKHQEIVGHVNVLR
jgi:gliding motility-associated-like protein